MLISLLNMEPHCSMLEVLLCYFGSWLSLKCFGSFGVKSSGSCSDKSHRPVLGRRLLIMPGVNERRAGGGVSSTTVTKHVVAGMHFKTLGPSKDEKQ